MQSFNLNLVPGSFKQVFNLSQYDVGRELTAYIFDGASSFSIPSGATVKIEATKPSGFGFSVNCTFADNAVSIVTTDTMTDEWGRFPADLVISASGDVLGTANFLFDIEESPHPEGTTDGDAADVIPYLTELVNTIVESNSKVENMIVSATPLSYGATPTAVYDSDNNTLTFGIPTATFTDSDFDGNIVIS